MSLETPTSNVSGIRDPQQKLAALFGAVLVTIGVADFSGVLSPDGRFLGIFHISPAVNVVHVLTGVLALFLSRYAGAGTLFNKLGSVIYLTVFVVGSIGTLLGIGETGWETNALHLVLALVVGSVGFEGGTRRPS